MQGLTTNIIIFTVMGIGWVLRRVGKMSAEGLKSINSVLFCLLMPVSFFKAGLGFRPETLKGWRFTFVFLGAYLVATVACWFASKRAGLARERRGASLLTGFRPNMIFIGIPLMTLWLGAAGLEAMVICVAVSTVYINTAPVLVSQLAFNGSMSWESLVSALKKTVRNPILIGGVAGLILGATRWVELLPGWTMQVISILANCATGLALLVIGASLVPERLWSDVKVAWPDLGFKLFIHPVITLLAFLAFPVENPVLMRVAVVSTGISPAFNCFTLAQGMGFDSDYAALLVASASLLGIGTLLFWMELTTRLFV